MIAGTATLSDARPPDNNSLCCSLHRHDFLRTEELDCRLGRLPAIFQNFNTLGCPHHYISAYDVAEISGELFTSEFYVWETRALRTMDCSPRPYRNSSLGLHTVEVAAVDDDVEDVV